MNALTAEKINMKRDMIASMKKDMKMNNLCKKTVLASVLGCTLLLGMTGCGKTKQTDGKEAEVSQVYVPHYIEISGDENTFIDDIFCVDETLYYIMNQFDRESSSMSEAIYCVNPKESEEPQFYKEYILSGDTEETLRSPMKRILNKDGGVTSVEQEFSVVYEGTEVDFDEMMANFKIYLSKEDQAGNETFCVDISSNLTTERNNLYIQHMVEDKDGNYFLSNGNSSIWIFDSNGNFIKEIKLQGNDYGGHISSFGTIGDGVAAYISDDQQGMALNVYNESKQDFSDSYDNLPKNCWNTSISKGIAGGVLLSNANALFEYHTDTKEYSEILNWMNVDLNGDYVEKVYALNEDIVVLYRDWNSGNTEIVLLKPTSSDQIKQKEKIVLGTMGLSQTLQSAVVNFNKNNEDYKIEVKDYSADIDWGNESSTQDYNDAMNKFKNEIGTGNGPDLFDACEVDLDMLAMKGVIEDLSPYLSKSQSLNRSDFIEPVLNAYTVDGKLCAIPSTFSVTTVMGRTSELGDRNSWTVDEMIAFAKQYPDSQLIQYMSKQTLLQYCLMFDFPSYVNWETGECKFQTDEFRNILEYANTYPSDEEVDYDISEVEAIRTHKALLYMMYLSEPQNLQIAEKIFEEPVTAIGYPCKEGRGVLVSGNDGVCMNAASKNKDAAWSFIESIHNGDYDKSYFWGFPTKKSLYDEQMAERMTPMYYRDEEGNIMTDEDGNPMEQSFGSYGYDDIVIELFAVKKEEADAIWELISNISGRMNYDTKLLSIVSEEVMPYFANQKTVDEVMDIIQSRIQIYVNENR